jgi:DNA-binding IscR family transcriptional regulator
MWKRAKDAVAGVYDSTTFADLMEEELSQAGARAADYCI